MYYSTQHQTTLNPIKLKKKKQLRKTYKTY